MKFTIEEILSLIDITIDDKINEITVKEGKRGIRGKPGVDGKDGKDGLSFNWDDYKNLIYKRIDDNKLKFTDLTKKEVESLKGEKGDKGPKGKAGLDGKNGLDGKDGLNGKDFIWEEHSGKIQKYIAENSLTFEKLTDEEKLSLRGPRGLRGQKGQVGRDGRDGVDGKDFIFEEHKEKIINHLNTLRLKFSDLTEDERNSLQGDRGPRGQRGRQGLDGEQGVAGLTGAPGLPGINGIDGRSGRDGIDGKDAPMIVNIELKEWNSKFYFVFHFDNGTSIETRKIDKPIISQLVQQIIQGAHSILSIPVSDEGTEITNSLRSLDFVGGLIDATDDGNGNVTVTVSPPDTSSIVIPNVPCETSVFLGAAVIMLPTGVARNGIATGISTANILGFVEAKTTAILCDIRVTGITPEHYVGLDVTKEYYLSTSVAGGITTTIPTTTGHAKIKLGQPYTDKKMLFAKGDITEIG